MPVEGISPNGPLAWRLVRIKLRRANTNEAKNTRLREPSAELRVLDAHTLERRTTPIEKVRVSARRRPRFVPSSNWSLALLDFQLIGAAKVFILGDIYERLGFTDLLQVSSVAGLSLIVTLMFLYATGSYRSDAHVSVTTAMSRVPVALAFSAALMFPALHYGFPLLYPTARVFLSVSRCATFLLTSTGIALCASIAARLAFQVLARQHVFQRRVLVVGTGEKARYLHNLIGHGLGKSVSEVLFAPESILTGACFPSATQPLDSATTSTMHSISDLARRLDVDEVVVAVDNLHDRALDDLLVCKASGTPVTNFNRFLERETGRVELTHLEIPYLLHSSGFQIGLIDEIVKRLMDIGISLAALVISLPVLLLAVVAIRIESRGSAFYRQQRVTRDGNIFWLFKLRTMKVDAEQNGPQWTDAADPRITRVGAFLRRTRIDEVPQLINILRGDMSLVGPRPERPEFVSQLTEKLRLYNIRHSVRAGLTGWAQINFKYGASVEDSKRKLEYDLYYIKNFSIVRDLLILLQTVRVLIWPDGVR